MDQKKKDIIIDIRKYFELNDYENNISKHVKCK